MKKKFVKIGLWIFIGLIIAGGFGYYHVFGITTSKALKSNVYAIYAENLTGQIGAKIIAVDSGENWVLVDTTLGPLAGRALAEIKALKNQPIKYAFITHWHPDHSGGIGVFSGGAEIIAHENVQAILAREREAFGLVSPGSTHKYEALPAKQLPEQTYQATALFSVDGFGFEAIHYPNAHTDGDTAIFVDELQAVAVGDLVWPGGFPFIDVYNGGSAQGVLAAIDAILARIDGRYIIISGHGDPMNKKEFHDYREMVAGTIDFVLAAKEAGKVVDEIIAQGLPGKWAPWASDLVPEAEWIRMIYSSS